MARSSTAVPLTAPPFLNHDWLWLDRSPICVLVTTLDVDVVGFWDGLHISLVVIGLYVSMFFICNIRTGGSEAPNRSSNSFSRIVKEPLGGGQIVLGYV